VICYQLIKWPKERKMIPNRCPACQQLFTCDLAEGKKHCWCRSYPHLLPMKKATSCFCPNCLCKAISEYQQLGVRPNQLED